MRAFLALFALTAITHLAIASHFRYGTIEWWLEDPDYWWRVYFRVNTAWRNSFFGVAVNQTFVPGSICFRNGSYCINMSAKKQSEFLADDWMTGQFGPGIGLAGASWIHDYPQQTASWLVDHFGCCRIGALSNNRDKNWRISAVVKINSVNPIRRSPVSNTLPIVPLRHGIANAEYTLVATKPNPNSVLKFRMATPLELGHDTEYHPPTLQLVDENTGLMRMDTRNLSANSLWTTQQLIIDTTTGAYVPIDYIIHVKPFNTFCHPLCPPGVRLNPCATDSECICPQVPNKTCVSSAPVLLYTGMPDMPSANPSLRLPPPNGDIIHHSILEPLTINLVAHDAIVTDPTKPVTIYVGSLPPGATLSTQSSCSTCCPGCNNAQQRVLQWTPSSNIMGDFTVCVGVRSYDGTELPYSQHCFTITITPPICGNGGTPTPPTCVRDPATCSCNCRPGFDPNHNCFQCKDNYYGPNCIPCPTCLNGGVCDDGVLGSGVCHCPTGYTGPNCNIAISQRCQQNTYNVTSSSNNALSYVNPVSAQLYTSPNQKFAYTVSLMVPAKPVIDIVIAVDVTTQTTDDDVRALHNYIQIFQSYLINNHATTPLIGLASFTNGPSSYRRVSPLTADSNMLRQRAETIAPSTPVSTTGSYVMDAIGRVADDTGYGWRTNSFKIVMVLTKHTTSLTTLTIDALRSKLHTRNIVPIILSRSHSHFHSQIISALGFGFSHSTPLNSPMYNWHTLADQAVDMVLQRAAGQHVVRPSTAPTFTITDDEVQVTSSTHNVNFQVKAPDSLPAGSQSRTIEFLLMGWGKSEVFVQLNRAPTAHATNLVTNQNIATNFTVSATDDDNNILHTTFLSLPPSTVGSIYYNGYKVIQGTQYETTKFTFIPANNYYNNGGPSPSSPSKFKFEVNDGCTDSNEAEITIRVNFVNQPPSGENFNVTGFEDQEFTINFESHISDFDNVLSELRIKIISVPASIGYLRSTENKFVANNVILPDHKVIFVPNPHHHGETTFKYAVMDNRGGISPTYTVNVKIYNVNDPPMLRTATGETSFYVKRGLQQNDNNYLQYPFVQFYVEDYDVEDSMVINITHFNCKPTTAPGSSYCSPKMFFVRQRTNSPDYGPDRPDLILQAEAGSISPPLPIPNNPPYTWRPAFQQVPPGSPFLQSVPFYLLLNLRNSVDTDELPVFSDGGNTLKVTLVAIDSKGAMSAPLNITVDIAPVDPPTPYGFSYSTPEDTPVTIEILAYRPYDSSTDSFPCNILVSPQPPRVSKDDTLYQINAPGYLTFGNPPVNVTGTHTPMHATVINEARTNCSVKFTMTYKPALNFHGEVTFSVAWIYSYTNSTSDITTSKSATYTITVTPVNDPPTTSDVTVLTYQDQPVFIDSITAESLDHPLSKLTLVIQSKPAKGVLRYKGLEVSVNQEIPGGPDEWKKLEYTPPPYEFSVLDPQDTKVYASFNFYVKDPAGDKSNTSKCDIIVVNVDDPPYSRDLSIITDENVMVRISFPMYDHDPGDVDKSYAVVLVPTGGMQGRLWQDQAKTKPINETYSTGKGLSNAFVWYEPPFDRYSFDETMNQKLNTSNPMDTFFFKIVTDNENQLESDIYKVDVHVRFVNQPPRFYGELYRTIFEDTTDDVILRGVDDKTNPSDLEIFILSLPSRGVLRDGAGGESMPITSASPSNPYRVSDELGIVSFTPGLHENGKNYTHFTFMLFDGELSSTYTIFYDVEPVNTPPEIIPVNFNRTVVLFEKQSATLLFDVYDIDDDADTLTAQITTVPLRGTLYACKDLNDPCEPGEQLTLSPGEQEIELKQLAPGRFGVHFVPLDVQAAFTSYTIAFRATDPHGARSTPPTPVSIHVLPINDPPVITAPDRVNTFVEQEVLIPVSVDDPDAGNAPIMVQISIVPGGPEGTAISLRHEKAFEERPDPFRPNRTEPPFCVGNTTEITCVAPLKILNEMLSTLWFIPTGVADPTNVTVVANDLGAGGNPSDPNNVGLTDEKTVIVAVEYHPQVQEGSNNLTFTAIGAAVAGALLATLTGLFIRHKLKRVSEDYFNVFAGDNENVISSPLYQESPYKGENPLFDGRRTVDLPGGHDGYVAPRAADAHSAL